MPEPTPAKPHDETQDLNQVHAYLPVEGLPKRKAWWESWKVRCCWVACAWPASAGSLELLGQWRADDRLHVSETYVWQAMLPWMLLAFNELATDVVKVWHEWKTGIRG
jgi:hypothetical protein